MDPQNPPDVVLVPVPAQPSDDQGDIWRQGPPRVDGPPPQQESSWPAFEISNAWMAASVLSGALCTYHGYKRNDSVGWALGWGALGSLFPVVTPVIALAQGFGKKK